MIGCKHLSFHNERCGKCGRHFLGIVKHLLLDKKQLEQQQAKLAKWAHFGSLVADQAFPWGEIDTDYLCEMGVKAEVCEELRYDPEQHAHMDFDETPEPGDPFFRFIEKPKELVT